YQNVFAQGAQRTRQVPITGGMTLDRVVVAGMEARAGAPAAGRPTYRIDGTIMRLTLPRPLPPGGRVALDVAWHFTVPPRGAPRTGHDDKEVFVVAQWYPQVATYDDLYGWHDLPYWSNGEFYLEYGDFDVSLTVPEGWLVTASGTLENPDEVLTPETIDRLSVALSQDDVVHVITSDELEAEETTVREPGGQLTWRYTARNVRDFAFASSNRYQWDATRALLPDADGDGRQEVVGVHAFYRPEASGWREAARYLRHALTFHATHWHPYPYPKIAAAEGPIGGMEYPMLVFIGAPADPQALYSVLAHELAHQWWSMTVGSNETRYAWQDEGLTTYVEDLSVRDFFPRADDPALATMDSYLRIA
ncbi:MAG: M1 family metallopeptidase, partial [Longimicrobiales bacterium]